MDLRDSLYDATFLFMSPTTWSELVPQKYTEILPPIVGCGQTDLLFLAVSQSGEVWYKLVTCLHAGVANLLCNEILGGNFKGEI